MNAHMNQHQYLCKDLCCLYVKHYISQLRLLSCEELFLEMSTAC